MKNRLRMPIIGALAAASVLTLAACGGDADDDAKAAGVSSPGASTAAQSVDSREGWPKTFRLGLFGGDDAEETLRNQEPFIKYLEERLQVKIEPFTGTSYSAVIEAMRADRVDAMMVGPFSYVLAVQEADAEALAVNISTKANPAVYDPNIKPAYNSVIFTKKGSGIDSLDDLKGKDFNFVDPASTSGHLAPKTLLLKNGLNPDKDMKTVFAGTHPTSVLSVWNGKAPAGATNEGNLFNLDAEGQIEWCSYPDGQINKVRSQAEIDALYASCPDGSIVVLAQTDPIPNTPFAVRKELPASFKAAVKEALLATKDEPELIAVRKNWFADPSVEAGLPTLDAYYNSLRDIAKLLNLDLKELD